MLRNAPSRVPTISPCPSPSAPTLQPLPATVCSLRERTYDPYTTGQILPSAPSSVSGDDEAGFDDLVLQPLPSALTNTLTHYDPAAESTFDDLATPRPLSHKRSLTDTFFDKCTPLVQRATTTLQQQKASLNTSRKSFASFISSPSPSPTKSRSPSSWFSGASAPVNIGLIAPHHRNFDPTDDEEEEDEMFTGQAQKGGRDAQRPATSTGKFSWILGGGNSAAKSPKPKQEESFQETADELLNMSIETALFPHGPADPLNPAAFNDLLAAAESLLQRYQTAYRQQAILISELRAEQSAQEDEFDGAETRARHLKLQLDDMAAKAAEQDRQMLKLKRELDTERELRRQEEEARIEHGRECRHSGSSATFSRPSSPSAARPSPKRLSVTHSIDSGFESGDESSASSIRSRISPTISSSETLTQTLAEAEEREPVITVTGPPLQQRPSFYDKVMGRTGANAADTYSKGLLGAKEANTGAGPWQVVSKMREENAHLRVRVRELESAVEDSLDLMMGIGLVN